MPLKDTQIRALKPKDKPYKIYDENGLFLLVRGNSKLWRFRYIFNQKEKILALGQYPSVSLKDARAKRDDAQILVKQGIDPAENRKEKKAEALAVQVERQNTFEKIAREWHEKNREQWTPKYADTIIHRLEKYIYPHIGNVPISEIEMPKYIEVIKILENRGTFDLAKRIAQVCGQVTTYAVTIGALKNNYAAGLAGTVKKIPVRHLPAITDPDKLGQLLIDIDNYHGEFSTYYALKLMPLVFLRSKELRGARWSEINFDDGIWIVPAERMKGRKNHKREHVVPLSRQAIEIFHAIRPYTGNYELVFPGRLSNTQPITDMTLLNALRRMGYGREELCIHGFRTTASSLLNEKGYNPDAIEIQLSHVFKNSVRAAYNRAQYLPERHKMMQEWADNLDELREKTMQKINKNK